MLLPMDERCTDLHRENTRQTVVVTRLKPGEALTYSLDGQKRREQADSAGLWRVPVEAVEKVCVSK
jgi:hypothetical protein